MLAIEVLSESASYTDLKGRARDLEAMGIANIWLIDPEARTAERWIDNAWQPVQGSRLSIEGSPMYLDLAWLWKKLGPQG